MIRLTVESSTAFRQCGMRRDKLTMPDDAFSMESETCVWLIALHFVCYKVVKGSSELPENPSDGGWCRKWPWEIDEMVR